MVKNIQKVFKHYIEYNERTERYKRGVIYKKTFNRQIIVSRLNAIIYIK